MKLSTFFFILTPFGFFCTENGTGLITGFIFLIIGIVCKMFESGVFDNVGKPKVRISPEEFWKIQFRQKLNEKKPGSNFNYSPDCARDWADYIARNHGINPPSDIRFEEICKEMGLKTLKSIEAEADVQDRIEVGKYYLLGKLEKMPLDEYMKLPIEELKICRLASEKKKELRFEKGGHYRVGGYLTFSRFGKDDNEMWQCLTQSEKNKAKEWLDEWKKEALKNA